MLHAYSLMSGGGESLFNEVGEADISTGKEGADGVSLGLAEVGLLRGGEPVVLLNGHGLVALGQSEVRLDELLKSRLHFFIYYINIISNCSKQLDITMASFADKFLKDLEELSASENDDDQDQQGSPND